MGRRSSRMGLRGKPGLILVTIAVLSTVFLFYYFRSSSQSSLTVHERKHDHFHRHHKDRFNLGRAGNFDENKFIRKMKNPVEPSETSEKKEAERQKQIHAIQQDLGRMDSLEDDKNLMKNDDSMNKVDSNYKEQLERNVANKIQNRITELKFNQPALLDLNEYEKLYRKPNPDDSKMFENMKHIVHLDFKGAAPKLSYFKYLFPVLTSLGATGLLVEYEDMFPFSGELSFIAADNSYKKEDLLQFLMMAKENNLEIIPLVQMFGHLEFVLKYEKYSHLRENDNTPQVIMPLVNETYTLLEKIIDQMMTVHADSKFIHLGCDEVYQLGSGKSKIHGLDPEDLFFQHVSRLVRYVKNKYPMVTPIIWDDQLRKIPAEMLRKYGLGDVIEPMIWAYTPNPVHRVSEDTWQRYGEVFKNVWAASSFKGATGSAQYFTNITYHLSNHYGWIDIITKMKSLAPRMKFRGVVLTGWQRYDHFATLCELLPVAIPSLGVCLSAISNGGFTNREHKIVQTQLGCSADLKECKFPGSDIYTLVQELKNFENSVKSNNGITSRLEGWLTDYHIQHGFSSPGQLGVLTEKLQPVLERFSQFKTDFHQTLSEYFDKPTIDEWIAVHIQQKLTYYSKKVSEAKSLMSVKTWLKRPLQGQQVAKQQSGEVQRNILPAGRIGQNIIRNNTDTIRFKLPNLQNKIQKQAMKGLPGNSLHQPVNENQQSANNNPGLISNRQGNQNRNSPELISNHQGSQNINFLPNHNGNVNFNAGRIKLENHGNFNSNLIKKNPVLMNKIVKKNEAV